MDGNYICIYLYRLPGCSILHQQPLLKNYIINFIPCIDKSSTNDMPAVKNPITNC